MGTKLSELVEATAIAISDIFHLRTVGGIDKKITSDNLIKTVLNLIGTTKGDLVVRGTSIHERLAAGAVNTVLKGKGASILPAYDKVVLEDITSYSRVRVTKNNAQSIPNVTATIVQYDDEVFDNLNEFASYRFTAKKAGYYLVKASLASASVSWGAGEYWRIDLYKNGAINNYGYKRWGDAVETIKSTLSNILYLAATDYIDVRIYHNQGAAVNTGTNALENYLAIHRLS